MQKKKEMSEKTDIAELAKGAKDLALNVACRGFEAISKAVDGNNETKDNLLGSYDKEMEIIHERMKRDDCSSEEFDELGKRCDEIYEKKKQAGTDCNEKNNDLIDKAIVACAFLSVVVVGTANPKIAQQYAKSAIGILDSFGVKLIK